ncbi:MAG: hypothetical protein ACRDMA_04920, partial [Solirubrobacterales bacterium]
ICAPSFQSTWTQRPSPPAAWSLHFVRRSKWARIEGLQRFALVVRAAKRVPTIGTASVRATVRRKRFGLLSYRAALADGEPLRFTVP